MKRKLLISIFVFISLLTALSGADTTKSSDTLNLNLNLGEGSTSFAEAGFTYDTLINLNNTLNTVSTWSISDFDQATSTFSSSINLYWRVNSVIKQKITISAEPFKDIDEKPLVWSAYLSDPDQKSGTASTRTTILENSDKAISKHVVYTTESIVDTGYKILSLEVYTPNLANLYVDTSTTFTLTITTDGGTGT